MTIVAVSAGPPGPAELADPAHARTWKAAQDFEAMALGALLAPMFETVDSAHSLLGGGEGEATWQPMLTQEMANAIARGGGLGLAAPVYRQMLRSQEGHR